MDVRKCFFGYLRGLRDSLKSFFVLHKLDEISEGERKKLEKKQKELLHPKITTVLQQRRQTANSVKGKEKRIVQLVEKPKAVAGLFYSLILNVALVLALCITKPDKNSTSLRMIHGCVYLSALIISRICSSIWCSDVANASLKYTGVQTPSLSLSRTTGDFCSAVLLDSVFFFQTLFVSSIPLPYISRVLAFIHMALLNSLFSFEYLWMSLGIGLRSRINRIEHNWPYFVGYGTVLTIFTNLTDSVMVNTLLFGALFPFCVISSYLVHDSDYAETKFPYVHIFGPSVATTNYVTTSLSAVLKSFGNKGPTSTQMAKTSRISLRDHHHSHSPSRPGSELRARHSRYGRSAE